MELPLRNTVSSQLLVAPSALNPTETWPQLPTRPFFIQLNVDIMVVADINFVFTLVPLSSLLSPPPFTGQSLLDCRCDGSKIRCSAEQCIRSYPFSGHFYTRRTFILSGSLFCIYDFKLVHSLIWSDRHLSSVSGKLPTTALHYTISSRALFTNPITHPQSDHGSQNRFLQSYQWNKGFAGDNLLVLVSP